MGGEQFSLTGRELDRDASVCGPVPHDLTGLVRDVCRKRLSREGVNDFEIRTDPVPAAEALAVVQNAAATADITTMSSR